MKLLYPVLLFIVLFSFTATAQTTFQKIYGGSTGNSFCRHVEQTTDGGYILVGSTNSFGAGGNDIYLVKTNFKGDTLWTRTYGGSGDDDGYCVKQTPDSGYILCGSTQSFGRVGAYVIKTNSTGDTLWTRVYGYTASTGYSVSLTSDGGYVIGGVTIWFSGTPDMNLIKLDSSGNFLWNKTCGGQNSDFSGNAVQTSDGGYLMFGTKRYGSGLDRFAVVKTNVAGDTLNKKLFAYLTSATSDCWYGIQTANGGIAMVGNAVQKMVFIKADSNFNNDSLTLLDGANNEGAMSVYETTDNGFLICGFTNSIGMGDSDVYMAKLNPSGYVQWSAVYGGAGPDIGNYAKETIDGGYIIGGTTGSFGTKKMYLVKTDSLGQSGCNQLFDTLTSSIMNNNVGTSNLWYPYHSDSSFTTSTAVHTGAVVGALCLQVGCSANIPTSTNVTCNGGCDGGATVSFSGGSGPYTYQWIPVGGSAPSATGLCAGNYTVNVSDAVGCSSWATVIITQPPAVTASGYTINNVSCNGGNNGMATVNPGGGVGVYSYVWSPAGGTNVTASNLGIGTYTVTVIDANGCTATSTATITEPTLLTAFAVVGTNASCATCTDGSAYVIANGGTPGYTYSWNTSPVQTTFSATGLSPGNYTVCVTDANGCSTCSGVTITYPTSIKELNNSMFSIHPNPARNTFTISWEELNIEDGILNIYDVTGRVVHQQILTSVNQQINNSFSPGIYFIKVTEGEKVYQQKLVVE
jgi:hypothetical protein